MRSLAGRIQGHRQWADAVLLRQAAERDGALVTFDMGIKALASRDLGGRVVVLKGSTS